jgi:membrane-associated phospholipid phosphatase
MKIVGKKIIMSTNIIHNYSRLKTSLFFLPLFLLLLIVLFLYSQDALSTDQYVQIQRSSFLFINGYLGQYPNLEYNLTQLGDALIALSFLSIFIVVAPKIWETLLSSLLVSLILSCSLKTFFAVPRPAVVFTSDHFIIVGKILCGHNSLPSGHSIIVFTVLTVLMFAFMPKEMIFKVLWSILIIGLGLMLIFTRVGVGAHYPIDVMVGGIVGYVSGLLGIFISRKYKIWNWINHKKYHPVFMLLLVIFGILLINRIVNENLIIFYLAFISLVVSLYKIITVYVKK